MNRQHFIVRVGVALYLGDTVPPAKDERSYSVLAERLATGHGYSFPTPWYPFTAADAPTSHWSFLYTAFVAAVYAVAGPHPLAARLVQAVAVFKLHPGESLGHGVLKAAPAAAPIAAPKPAVKAPVRKTAPPAAGKPAALPKAKAVAAGGDDDWESF